MNINFSCVKDCKVFFKLGISKERLKDLIQNANYEIAHDSVNFFINGFVYCFNKDDFFNVARG